MAKMSYGRAMTWHAERDPGAVALVHEGTATTRASRTGRSLVRVALASLVLAGIVSIVGPAANPAPVAAGTAEYIEGLLIKWTNEARASRGLPALKVGWRLMNLAGDRAADMASKNRMFHVSCLSCTLRSRDVSFSYCGEIVAYTSYPWGYDAAKAIFRMSHTMNGATAPFHAVAIRLVASSHLGSAAPDWMMMLATTSSQLKPKAKATASPSSIAPNSRTIRPEAPRSAARPMM